MSFVDILVEELGITVSLPEPSDLGLLLEE